MDPAAPPDPDRTIVHAHACGREILIAESFARVTGGELVRPYGDIAQQMWDSAAVIVAHGTEPDPVFFYGNRAALDLFEMPAAEFIRLPSRFSAEPLNRQERARLLADVSARNFISNYAGIRIAKSGRRFRIERATVWNLLAVDGSIHGQAACFEHWRPLGQD